ncbi:hypothetical protein PMI18_00097, partial [Pseudomonas sp. GM102]
MPWSRDWGIFLLGGYRALYGFSAEVACSLIVYISVS